jgi:hypothetical protein
MAHDKHGTPVHVGDQVRVGGKYHHVHGVITDDGEVNGDLKGISKAKFVAFARDLEVTEKAPGNDSKPAYGPGCIVWGNGPAPAPQPPNE